MTSDYDIKLCPIVQGEIFSSHNFAIALKPSKRYCRNESSYLTESLVEMKTSLKSRNAGMLSASIAGQRGWSMIGTLVICSVAVFPSGLKVSPPIGTGLTQ